MYTWAILRQYTTTCRVEGYWIHSVCSRLRLPIASVTWVHVFQIGQNISAISSHHFTWITYRSICADFTSRHFTWLHFRGQVSSRLRPGDATFSTNATQTHLLHVQLSSISQNQPNLVYWIATLITWTQRRIWEIDNVLNLLMLLLIFTFRLYLFHSNHSPAVQSVHCTRTVYKYT